MLNRQKASPRTGRSWSLSWLSGELKEGIVIHDRGSEFQSDFKAKIRHNNYPLSGICGTQQVVTVRFRWSDIIVYWKPRIHLQLHWTIKTTEGENFSIRYSNGDRHGREIEAEEQEWSRWQEDK